MMKQKVRKEYIRRVRLVLDTQLNSQNKFKAINSLAVPVLIYSFTIVNWTVAEIKRLDTKTRKLLTCKRAHHPKADVDRLYLKRSQGGRGLLQAEMSYKLAIIGMNKYLSESKDWMMNCVKTYEAKKKLYSITRKAEEIKQELEYEESTCENLTTAVAAAKAIKNAVKQAALKRLHNNWRQKPLHGKFQQRASNADVNEELTFSWLKSSSLKSETEGFIFAAQDQSLKTRNYLRHIMKTGESSNCRLCNQHQETIDHIVAGCPTLAIKEYLIRHNKVATYIHWKICKYYDLKTTDAWYEHQTPPVVSNEKATVMWDFSIHTDRKINANRPDIVVRDKLKKTCLLIDVSIPSDRNTSLKTFEKISKYKDLEIEIEKSWKEKAKTIPIIVGALGVVNKSTTKYLEQLPGDTTINEVQKIALLGTATILRKALSLNTA
jgi:hypothetical protein